MKPHTPLVTTEQTKQHPELPNSNIEPVKHPKMPTSVERSPDIPSNITTENINLRQSTQSRKSPVRYTEEF